MPEGDGFEILSYLKQHPETMVVPVVMLSGPPTRMTCARLTCWGTLCPWPRSASEILGSAGFEFDDLVENMLPGALRNHGVTVFEVDPGEAQIHRGLFAGFPVQNC